MAPKKKAPQTNPSLPEGDEGVADPPVGNCPASSENPTSENPSEENTVPAGTEVAHTKEIDDTEREALLAEKEAADLRARLAQAKEDAARRQREEETNAEVERYRGRKRRAQRESQELQK